METITFMETVQMSEMLLVFAQIVDGRVGELHGESSQSSVCHLLEKQGNTAVVKLETQ